MTYDVNPNHRLFTHVPAPLRQVASHLDDCDETWIRHSLSKLSFQAHKFEVWKSGHPRSQMIGTRKSEVSKSGFKSLLVSFYLPYAEMVVDTLE